MNVDVESARLTPAGDRLRLTEIFYSIQGEAQFSGWPTVFVRLTGCPLRCSYCDTAYAFTGGEWRSIDSIATEVASYPTSYVCVTGGEPLAQRSCPDLLTRLCDRGYRVALETSGAMDISVVRPESTPRCRRQDAGLRRSRTQSLGRPGAPEREGFRQDCDLRPRGLRLGEASH